MKPDHSLPLTLAAVPASECLALIRRRNVPWWKLGLALGVARDQKRYAPFPTFEAFVRARLGFTTRRANQLIEAAETFEAIARAYPEAGFSLSRNPPPADAKSPPIAVPTSEKQLRLLQKLNRPLRPYIWARACEKAGGQVPDARTIKETIRKAAWENTELAGRVYAALRERHDVRLTYRALDALREELAGMDPAVLAPRYWRRHRRTGLARVRWAVGYFTQLLGELEKHHDEHHHP